MVQYFSLHELFTQDASLFLNVALKDLKDGSVFLLLSCGERCQIDLRDELEHTPAKHLAVFVFVVVFDQLLWVDVH